MKSTYNKRAYFYALVMMACLCSLYAGLVDLDYYWQADLGMHELKFLGSWRVPRPRMALQYIFLSTVRIW